MRKTKITSNKKIRKKATSTVLILVILIFSSLFFWFTASAQYTYKPMENIPGFEGIADFPSYALAISKFAIWTVGIVALFMIIFGGFMYITSAGNTSRLEVAKRVIFDAIYGLIVVLGAWLLLYVINPDLVKVTLSLGTTSTGTPVVPPVVRPPVVQKVSCNDINSTLATDLKNADNGVPPALLAAFMKRECSTAMTNASACGTNNSYGAGGPMQFIDKTWSSLGCSGSKFNRQDALKCAARKISQDSGGNYDEAGVRRAAQRYCGSCTNVNACGGNYCDGIWSNYQGYISCSI
jgi:hypothetical protein